MVQKSFGELEPGEIFKLSPQSRRKYVKQTDIFGGTTLAVRLNVNLTESDLCYYFNYSKKVFIYEKKEQRKPHQ